MKAREFVQEGLRVVSESQIEDLDELNRVKTEYAHQPRSRVLETSDRIEETFFDEKDEDFGVINNELEKKTIREYDDRKYENEDEYGKINPEFVNK